MASRRKLQFAYSTYGFGNAFFIRLVMADQDIILRHCHELDVLRIPSTVDLMYWMKTK